MSETSSGGGCGGELAPCGCMECAPLRVAERAAAKPTIPLRIRVGVTADGEYLAGGTNDTVTPLTDEQLSQSIAEAISRPIVAWHWVRAEVPMPETEQGDVAGTVEQPCAGMPSDQKGSE